MLILKKFWNFSSISFPLKLLMRLELTVFYQISLFLDSWFKRGGENREKLKKNGRKSELLRIFFSCPVEFNFLNEHSFPISLKKFLHKSYTISVYSKTQYEICEILHHFITDLNMKTDSKNIKRFRYYPPSSKFIVRNSQIILKRRIFP